MKYVTGNLLDLAEQGQFDIIVHGCNCFNTMGSGIAKQIKDRYPKAYAVDQMTKRGVLSKLGKVTQAYINGESMQQIAPNIRGLKMKPYGFTIINAYTQYRYGSPEGDCNYVAISDAFTQIKMLHDMNIQAPPRIGIPQIGAGLAGGDWVKIESIIDEIGISDLTCVVFDGANP